MTPSAKRAKAQVLVAWVRDRLQALYPEFTIDLPRTSAHGEDLPLPPELRAQVPYSFEMKNQRGYAHLAADMRQTVKNSGGYTPVLVVKSPYEEPLVVMRWTDWERTIGL